MANFEPQIDPTWRKELQQEFQSEYFNSLSVFLNQAYSQHVIYPPIKDVFGAYNNTPLDKIKVVIIGQDPYHREHQAHGLSFSVNHDIKIPPSLSNIIRELKSDVGIPPPSHGNLNCWTTQGVFLLNATLTVQAKNPGSHQNQGWETFTDYTIELISKRRCGIVFLLWGKFAAQKMKLIDLNKHHILKTTHPSPFSAYKGFLGCKHFSKTNELLAAQGRSPINWQI